jgi:acetyl-CoA decarbonylase/synthase complex subunit delta
MAWNTAIQWMRMASLTQQDEKLQFPIICNLSKEVWKSKEVHLPDNENNMGNAKNRGILLEAMSAMAMLLAGGDIIIMRHPEAIKLIKEMVADLTS